MEYQSTSSDLQPKTVQQDAPQIRRFGIIDLILITTAMAVAFKLHSLFSQHNDLTLPVWFVILQVCFSAIFTGLALPAFYWIPMQWAQTGKLFRAPGHWMIAVQWMIASAHIIVSTIQLFFLQVKHEPMEPIYAGGIFIFTFCYLVGLILFFTAAFSQPKRWRVATVLLGFQLAFAATNSGLQGIAILGWHQIFSWANILGVVSNVAAAIAATSIVIAMLIDFSKKASRDWLHWIGLIVTLNSLTVLPVLRYLFMRVVFPD